MVNFNFVVPGTFVKIPIRVSFDKDTTDTTLYVCPINTLIRRVSVVVYTVFDTTKEVSIGFPADVSAIAPAASINLKKTGCYIFESFYELTVAKTLSAYFTGASTVGSAEIVVEYQD